MFALLHAGASVDPVPTAHFWRARQPSCEGSAGVRLRRLEFVRPEFLKLAIEVHSEASSELAVGFARLEAFGHEIPPLGERITQYFEPAPLRLLAHTP